MKDLICSASILLGSNSNILSTLATFSSLVKSSSVASGLSYTSFNSPVNFSTSDAFCFSVVSFEVVLKSPNDFLTSSLPQEGIFRQMSPGTVRN